MHAHFVKHQCAGLQVKTAHDQCIQYAPGSIPAAHTGSAHCSMQKTGTGYALPDDRCCLHHSGSRQMLTILQLQEAAPNFLLHYMKVEIL